MSDLNWIGMSDLNDTLYDYPSYEYGGGSKFIDNTNLWGMLDKVLQSSLQLSDSFNRLCHCCTQTQS